MLQGSTFGIALLLKYSSKVNLFKRQALLTKGHLINALEITDDHRWVAMGLGDGSAEIYLYEEGLRLDQSIKPNNYSVCSLSLTHDHQYLAIGYEEGNEVPIYYYTNDSFSPFQILYFGSSTRRRVQLSHDHQHLLVAHRDGLVELY